MHKIAALLALIVFVANALVPLQKAQDENRIENSYIVVYNETVDPSGLASLMDRMVGLGARVKHTYSFRNFRGAALELSNSQLDELRQEDHLVSYIEENQRVSISQSCSVQDDAIWNLARLNSALTGGTKYSYFPSAGAKTTSYIIDTGIRVTHEEFEDGKRATFPAGANFVGDGINTDCNGHGTHVAGTVAGKTYGVAKLAHVVAVKVLDCDGSGSYDGVIAGINFVTKHCATKSTCNANMSLGGPYSSAVNDAVRNAISSGITFVVAAGNDNLNACDYSPASVSTAVTVGATDSKDFRSTFSNFGTCVNILAPGTSIKSAWYTSDTATNTISGTSMASPHVAGVVSLLQGETSGGLSPSKAMSELDAMAVDGDINLNCAKTGCSSTPNRLAHVKC